MVRQRPSDKSIWLCLAFVVAVLAQSFSLISATTSLPQSQINGPSSLPSLSSFQSQQHHSTSEGTNDQQQQLVLQLALVSARGSLAFWRPPEPELQPEPLAAAAAAATAQAHNSRPSQIINNHSKCPQLSSSSTGIKAFSSAELLAVEGSSVKLNFVIVGSLKQQHTKQQQQQLAGSKLSFRWTKNGQPLPVVSQQQQQQQNSKQRPAGQRPLHLFQRNQFSELIINENDIIRRYFANLPASSMANNSVMTTSPQEQVKRDGFKEADQSSVLYMLAPHFDERQINRLRFDAQLDSLLRHQQQNHKINIRWHQQPSSAQTRQQQPAVQVHTSQVDDFLADGQLIDWQKLESYLKLQASQLRLYLPASGSPPAPGNERTPSPECPQLMAAHQIEQLTIVQLETSRLTAQDAGLYTLEACTTASQQLRCQSVGFRLDVAQDWPILERTFEHQILEPGDRLSIKCEATGFTLPQISWFLDGQQLNEHKSSDHEFRQSQAGPDNDDLMAMTMTMMMMTASAAAAATTTNLRVGDYVSQDNHVHSFVNATRVQLTDGGLYRCQANNGFHLVEHEARIDVRGPASFARQLSNQSLLLSVDSQLRVQCPFSGYPISGVEWFFKPTPLKHDQQSANPALDSSPSLDLSSANLAVEDYLLAPPQQQRRYLLSSTNGVGRSKRLSHRESWQNAPKWPAASQLDEDREPDPERDEWLSQAGAITPPNELPPPSDDYPSDPSLPADYLPPYTEAYFEDDLNNNDGSLVGSGDILDYGDLQMDTQQSSSVLDRRRRDALPHPGGGNEDQQWVKLPQSRRHQVHSNGTLIVHELSRYDQGFYKCRVGSPLSSSPPSSGLYDGPSGRLISSNELHLSILVPPVISPFSSADSLREGMRNFLTCSVIEGDSPIRLSWLKDNQPIEDFIDQLTTSKESTLSAVNQDENGSRQTTTTTMSPSVELGRNNRQGRIRVETSNEYTSTLYFSHVDFRDNGNYTCMATNKAASVNYTAKMLVNVPPKWVKAPKDLEFTAGQNIAIDCQAKAYPSARVWWEIGISSESGTISSVATSNQQANKSRPTNANANEIKANHPPLHYRTIISNSRIHILENASLVIRDLQPNDQGYYLCQASNNFGSLSSLIKLTVNVGASFTSKYLLKYAKLGERVELDCDPTGQLPLEVGWFWRHPTVAAAAAAASSGPTLPTTTTAATMFAPQNNSSLGQRLFVGLLQQQQQQPSGDSPPKLQPTDFQETPEAASLQSALAAKISFETTKTTTMTSGGESVRLIINSVTRQHSAEFICKASNRYGADERLVKLLVQEPPDQVRDLQPVQVDSRSLSINWPIPYNGNVPITGYTVEWAQAIVSSSSSNSNNGVQRQQPRKWSHVQVQQPAVTILGLSPLTSYEVKVRAHNQLGQSLDGNNLLPGVNSLLITTGEEAPNVPPSDIRAVPLSSSSIQLSWLAPPAKQQQTDSHHPNEPSIKGYYLGYRMTNSSTASTSSDSFVFKTVPLESSAALAEANPTDAADLIGHLKNDTSEQQQAAKRRIRVVIDDLKRATKYSIIVQAFNSAGPGPQSDGIETRTLLDDPPPMPMLRVGSVTFTSIELQWNFLTSTNNYHLNHHHYHYNQHQHHHYQSNLPVAAEYSPASDNSFDKGNATTAASETGPNDGEMLVLIEGFQLYYRSTTQSQSSGWLEKKLRAESHTMLSSGRDDISIVPNSDSVAKKPPAINQQQHLIGWQKSAGINPLVSTMRFTLDGLVCGNSYQIYLVAYNSIGSGEPSQIVRTRTRGSAPIAPRKQDFLVPNSTLALLNLDTWADGGCSISNFEIRYKQRDHQSSPLPSTARAHPSSASLVSPPPSQQQTNTDQTTTSSPWLLVASQISPDQRQLELRDLQPESWYSVWVLAESVAGKSEHTYTFMTLDKFGQLPLEALVDGNTIGTTNGNNNGMHALFSRYGNGSLVRSLLYNLSSSTNNVVGVSPMLMSACLALILFATCSLFLIRRYNGQQTASNSSEHQNSNNNNNNNNSSIMKDNDGSIDSDGGQMGACSSSSMASHYHHNHNHNQHQRARLGNCGQVGPKLSATTQVIAGHEHLSYEGGGGGGKPHPVPPSMMMMEASSSSASDYGHLSGLPAMAHGNGSSASPCKTTSTTILTGSSNHSTSNGSSQGVSLCGGGSTFRPISSSQPQQLPQLDLSRFMGDVMAAASTNNNYNPIQQQPHSFNSSTLTTHPLNHFNQCGDDTLDNGELAHSLPPTDDHHMMMQRFKTMPHQRTSCQSGIDLRHQYSAYCNASDNQTYNQQIPIAGQQIYSKLRLLHYNNNYQQSDQQQPVYDANTINLAMLSQQQHQKMTCTLNRSRSKRQQANCAAVGTCNLQTELFDCPTQQQTLDQQTLVDSYGQQQYATSQQNCTATGCGAPVENSEAGNGYGTAPVVYGPVGGSSIVSGSASSSTTNNNPTSQQQQQLQEQEQLISLTNEVNAIGNQCSKSQAGLAHQSNKINTLTGCGSANHHHQQQSPILLANTSSSNTNSNANNNTNEQTNSDYALPFPPKWV